MAKNWACQTMPQWDAVKLFDLAAGVSLFEGLGRSITYSSSDSGVFC